MERPVVSVKQGKLCGYTVKNVLGGNYISFKGIPFAAPPVGNLRFKDPAPPISWIGVRDASHYYGDIASQKNDAVLHQISGGEDCLYLSVHTASLDTIKPVIVWIHGGGFLEGSERSIRPDYLVAKDVVVVTLNYRLGVLGFLNLGHEIASGNQGMKDQVAALRWVKENIASFSGDPDNITLYGASAGAAAVQLLALSPMSRELFHKAILQSGTIGSAWPMCAGTPERSFKFAKLLGIDSKDPVEVFKFLQLIPTHELVKMHFEVFSDKEKKIKHILFGPTIDIVAKDPFLPRPLHELHDIANSMPMLVGHTSHEYLTYLTDFSAKGMELIQEWFDDYIRFCIPLKDPEEIERLSHELRAWYFNGKTIDDNSIPEAIQFLSDIYFTIGAKLTADERRNSKCASTYLYKFSYVGEEKTITKQLLKKLPLIGAAHVDDLVYIFYHDWIKVNTSEPPRVGTKDRITLERLTRMWTNFAKTGNPTPYLDEYVTVKWRPINSRDFNYLEIGGDLKNVSMEKDVYHLYRKYLEKDNSRIRHC